MIIDFLGGTTYFEVKDDLVAFEQGCSLLLYDTLNNSKIKMHSHNTHIKSICFCADNLIASASCGIKSQLIVSQYDTLNRVYSDFLPSISQNTTNIFMKCNYSTLIVVEVHTGYRVLVYDVKQFKLLFINDIESLNPCFGLIYIPLKPKSKIGTLELDQLKLWNLNMTSVVLTNRITLKTIRHIDVNQTLNLIILVLRTGELYILNADGDLISQLKSVDHEFTSSTSFESYLYLTTRAGKILIYEASSLNFVMEILACDIGYCQEIKHSSSLLVYQLNTGQLIIRDIHKKHLIDTHNGHFGRVNQVLWDPINLNQFYSVSSDGTYQVCTSKGDKFTLDSHTISHYQSKIKCLLIDNYRDEIYIGDNRGTLFVYSLIDFHFKSQVALTQNISIKMMAFSPAFQYLGVVFKNGFSIVLDCENQLKPMLKLEDPIQNVQYPGIKLYQVEFDLVKVNYTTTHKTFYMPRQDKTFNSLTIYNQHSLRQHQIEKGNGMLSALAVNLFTIEGVIYGFDLHPSKDYVFILSSYGHVYIYKIQSGEQRARINVPPFSRGIKVDKSGLYFAVAHLPLLNQEEKLKIEIPSIEYLTTNAKINTRTLPTSIRIYECGTGLVAESIQRIFSITDFDFSNDGQYLLVGGKEGKMSIWAISEDLMNSASDVIGNMKINPFFWRDYPIFIDEEDIQEQEVLDLSLLSKKTQNKPILKSQKYQQMVNPHTILQNKYQQ